MTARPIILVATTNAGKLREFEAALAEFDVVGLDDLDTNLEVAETGSTFEANAKIKAEAYSCVTDGWVLADDSGIEVDALGGRPGVHSARYGGPGLDDVDRVWRMLEELKAVPDDERGARFRCVLALASGGATAATFEGIVEGRITDEPVGEGGFGYDPVFFHEPIGKTFAEISREEKEALSHRGKAIRAFLSAWQRGRFDGA